MKDNSDMPFGKEIVSILTQILVQQYLDKRGYNTKENKIRNDENRSTSDYDTIYHFLHECSIGTYIYCYMYIYLIQ